MTNDTPPAAVCTRCGAILRRGAEHLINEQCAERPNGRRCGGVYGSALEGTDWQRCPICLGRGEALIEQCDVCQRTGWVYVRDRRNM
jgi:hypothetical protein